MTKLGNSTCSCGDAGRQANPSTGQARSGAAAAAGCGCGPACACGASCNCDR